MKKTDEWELKKVFSENLKRWIKVKGKSQVDIAIATGVSEAAVHYWVEGVKIPRMDKIVRIADVLGIDVSNLLYENVQYPEISNNHLKFILFETTDISDETLKLVLEYAKFVKENQRKGTD